MVILNYTKKKLKKLSRKKLIGIALEGSDLVRQISSMYDNSKSMIQTKEAIIKKMSDEIERLDKLSCDQESTINHKTRMLESLAKS